MSRAKGLQELAKFRAGKELTRSEAILAFCADCMGEYRDEIRNCKNPDCPLYNYMPYKNRTVVGKIIELP
jgi:hypothetical protein